MNLQAISSPDGEIIWVSGPLPGAVHDLRAARSSTRRSRRHVAVRSAICMHSACPACSVQQSGHAGGVHGVVLTGTPTRGIPAPGEHAHVPTGAETSPPSCKDANRAHARLRSRANAPAQLKTSHILRKLHCCLWQAGQLAKAIHVLQTARSKDEKHSLHSSAFLMP
jgi:hypothetical protein